MPFTLGKSDFTSRRVPSKYSLLFTSNNKYQRIISLSRWLSFFVNRPLKSQQNVVMLIQVKVGLLASWLPYQNLTSQAASRPHSWQNFCRKGFFSILSNAGSFCLVDSGQNLQEYYNGSFTMPDSQTETDANKICTEPSGNQCIYLWSVNTSTQFYTSYFYWPLFLSPCIPV